MSQGFHTSARIARRPDRVWAFMTDFTRAPDWMPGITSVRPQDDAPLGTGKTFMTELTTRGGASARPMTLAEWEPSGHAFALSSAEGSVTALYRYRLEADGTATITRLDGQCTGGGWLFRLVRPLVVLIMARHDRPQMARLKAFAEAELAPEP